MAVTTLWNPASAQDRKITILVYDYAVLSDKTFNEMENLTSLLLSRAAISTEWVHCLRHQEGSRPALCDGNLETGQVLFRILPKHVGQTNKLGDPLGSAVSSVGYGSLFASEIRKYANDNGLDEGGLMAYAAAHEIGHLLLGDKHAASGIMRAVWRKAEFQEMAKRSLGFNENERARLHKALESASNTQSHAE